MFRIYQVITNGKDRTMWEEIELKGAREPGPGAYHSEENLKSREAPSGGKFNMSSKSSERYLLTLLYTHLMT